MLLCWLLSWEVVLLLLVGLRPGLGRTKGQRLKMVCSNTRDPPLGFVAYNSSIIFIVQHIVRHVASPDATYRLNTTEHTISGALFSSSLGRSGGAETDSG